MKWTLVYKSAAAFPVGDSACSFSSSTWYRSGAFLAAALLVLVVLLLYSSSLNGSFVYYDYWEIQGNPSVTNTSLGLRNFTDFPRTALAGRGYYYRPLYFFSYWLLYRFAGPQPFAFHLFQLILHAVTVWMLFRLGRELLCDERIAFAGALLWAVHPAHVEAVAWISALNDVGCALFYFWAFELFLQAEKAERPKPILHLPAALAFLAALLFKEMAFSLPFLILAYWLLVPRQESWVSRASRSIPYVLVFVVYLLVRISVLGKMTPGGQPWNQLLPAVLRSLTLFGEHTRILLWPTHLSLGRTAGLQGGSLFGWPILALAGLGVAFVYRKRQPVLAFLIFWWPVALAPCLDMRQTTFPYVADRFSYLPSGGLCLGISYVLFRLLPQEFPSLRPLRFGLPLTAAVVFLWALQTSHTIPHWQNEDVFSAYSIRESPAIPVFHAVRGKVLATRGEFDDATKEYETALKLSTSAPQVWRSIAHDAYMGLGNIAKTHHQVDKAACEYKRAAAEMPANSLAYQSLASLYLMQDNFPKVAEYLSQVVKLDPQNLEAQFNIGVCWLKLKKYREAAEQFSAVASANPAFPNVWAAEAQAWMAAAAGHPPEQKQ